MVTQLAVPQAVVRLGGAGVMRKDPDFIPAYVVNHVLGGGSFTSRLYDEVREKRGLAYGVYSYLMTMRHAALFMASTQTQANSTREALELIEAQVQRMVKDGPTEDELGIDYIDKRNGLMDAVTIEDARRVAKRFGQGGLLVTVVGQPKDLTSKEPGG
jgi:zinc protease